ncbi:MAG TPA: glycine cleavage system aminomethyltransferase GcvT [Trebonia sp.]
MTTQPKQTPLRPVHERLGATMTEFAGWQMPLRYGSETAEHLAVRSAAGLFDLSHMGEIAVTGPGAAEALDYALTGWLSRLAVGGARYTMMCAPDGGILDDLVVYRQAADRFLVIANASNKDVVLAELIERASVFSGTVFGVTVADETDQTALIAIQGPNAPEIVASQSPPAVPALKYYSGCYAEVAGVPAWVARTGYTGEDGFEVFCPAQDAERVWASLTKAGSGLGVVPVGLAARDTLRLEAGMPLYGNELGRDVTPYEAELGRVVRLDKPGDFVGREALAQVAATVKHGDGPERVLVGLIARSRRVPRHGYPVLSGGAEVGTVTSGAPSPTLGVPVAMAYVTRVIRAPGAGAEFGIDVRGRVEPADLVELPFYRRSQQA